MTLDITPLSPALGAAVNGLDLSQPIDDTMIEALKREWSNANGLLVIKGQSLSESQQIDFAAHFGPLHRLQGHTVTKYLHPDFPEIYRVSNKKVDGVPLGRMGAGTYWHSDNSYEEYPAQASILYALEIPPYGGDTIFASTRRAYAALSESMKAFLHGKRAVHDFATARKGGFRNEAVTSDQLDALPPMPQPLVRQHIDSGEPCLFINPGFTSAIEGLNDNESSAILNLLFEHMTRPEFLYRHRWEQGDLVIWDNRCTMHYAVMDYASIGDRLMHRCTVIGEKPVLA